MGIEIKIARIKKGLTQIELAKELGCTRGTIHNLENGKTKKFKYNETLEKLCFILGLDINELI